MRIAACALLTFAACHPGSDDSFPIVPQGDDTTIMPGPDAAPADASGDSLVALTGRVCVVADLRNLTSGCATVGAADISVQLGTSSTFTADDGTFALTLPGGASPGTVWTASAQGYVTSIVKFGGPNLIPMTTEAIYDDLLLSNGMVQGGGQGAIIGRVVTAGAARPNITATTVPPAAYVTHYDGATPLGWEQDATGVTGVFWVPGAPAGNVTVTLAPGTAPGIVVPVGDQSITFATFDVP